MESLVLIPKELLDKIISNQELLINKINKLFSLKTNTGENFKYISEADAQKLLNKKSTWFWKQRTEGKLAYTKVGNTIYYKKEDINKLFENNFKDTF